MPRMMAELMEAVISSHADLCVAGRVPADGKFRNAVRRHRAYVVIVMQPDGDGLESSTDRLFWFRPSKELAIAEGGCKWELLVLHPHPTALGDLSVESRVVTIHSALW